MTRLLLGLNSPTPNGIDRVDLCFARHYLGSPQYRRTAIVLNRLRPWCIEPDAAMAVLAQVEGHWRENVDTGDDSTFHLVRNAIISRPSGGGGKTHAKRVVSRPAGRSRYMTKAAWTLLSQLPRALFSAVPDNGVFFHTTHFPSSLMFKWLQNRPHMRAVFFIHDLLPIKFPEFFTEHNQQAHRRSLDVLVRYGSGVIVNSQEVRNEIQRFLEKNGKLDFPILVAPIPADATFSMRGPVDAELAAHPYFVVCGTIEPRKNHLMLLNVWRELVRQDGANAPKLIVIGKRGWKNENVVDILERSTAMESHVVEVSGLSTAAMKHIVANARALLVPSFVEGYCLPMVEALALGTPVIASDIAVFRDIGKDRCAYLSPIDGLGWLDTVRSYSERSTWKAEAQEPGGQPTLPEYFARIDRFLCTLP